MWIEQRDWVLQISKAESFMLDGETILIFWRSNITPDQLDFKDDEEASAAFEKIKTGILNDAKIVAL